MFISALLLRSISAMDPAALLAGLRALPAAGAPRDGAEPVDVAQVPPPPLRECIDVAQVFVAAGVVSAAPAARTLGAFTGDMYQSKAHSQYLHMCKRRKKDEQRREGEAAASRPLHEAWNADRLRVGDHVGEQDRQACSGKYYSYSYIYISI